MFTTATGSLPCNDKAWSASTLDFVLVGGNAWDGSADGLFTFEVNASVSLSYVAFGALGLDF